MNIFSFFNKKPTPEGIIFSNSDLKICRKKDPDYLEDLEAFLLTLQEEKRVTLNDKVIEKISDSWFSYGFGNYISLDNIIEKFEEQWEKSDNSLVLSRELKKIRVYLDHRTRWGKDDIANKLFEEN